MLHSCLCLSLCVLEAVRAFAANAGGAGGDIAGACNVEDKRVQARGRSAARAHEVLCASGRQTACQHSVATRYQLLREHSPKARVTALYKHAGTHRVIYTYRHT
jgi:hypothetical protein